MNGEPLPNPYPGLRPFKFEESYLFFGREGQSEDLLRRLERNHFAAVVGTSGSGKSSLVRAGLLPLLSSGFMPGKSADFRISILRPGNSPIRNLAEALVQPEQIAYAQEAVQKGQTDAELNIGIAETILRRSAVGLLDYTKNNLAAGENLLVVVDQFEELFRFRKDSEIENSKDEAADFVKLFLEATRDKTSRVFVVITMRSDFLGDCSQFRDLPEAINDGQYLIPRLSREQLRQVIESPAKIHGARMSPALVTNLLNAIGDDQDQLPVLQHSLMRTWNKWAERDHQNSEITYKDYESRNYT